MSERYQLGVCLLAALVLHGLALRASVNEEPAPRAPDRGAVLFQMRGFDGAAESDGAQAAVASAVGSSSRSQGEPGSSEAHTPPTREETVRPAVIADDSSVLREAAKRASKQPRPLASRPPDPAPAEASTGGSTSAASAQSEPADGASYQQLLAGWIERHRSYPFWLRRQGVEGAGVLRLRVDRAGAVQLAAMEQAMTDGRLDRLILDIVRRADPFPAMPEEIPGSSFECLLDVHFDLASD